MRRNGNLPGLIFAVTVGDEAKDREVLEWFRSFVLPAYFTAPVDVQLEVRLSDRPDDQTEDLP